MRVAQKAISKVEGRCVTLAGVQPSARAIEIAGDEGDPRMIELILGETVPHRRRRGAFLVCETRHGFVRAAGVDRSNAGGGDVAVLLPLDPDASARRLREAFTAIAATAPSPTPSAAPSVSAPRVSRWVVRASAIHSGERDDAGRVCRAPVARGRPDRVGLRARRRASAGRPAAVVRGLAYERSDAGAAAGLMPAERDLFRDPGAST